MEKIATIAEKAQVSSYKVAEIIARNIQPHTIAENFILLACKKIVKSVLGAAAEREISNVPLSNDTISRRIEDMPSDIQKQVADKLYDGKKCSLQLEDSTDISQKCQLLRNIRFLDGDSVVEQFL
jgi:hypothetical protein